MSPIKSRPGIALGLAALAAAALPAAPASAAPQAPVPDQGSAIRMPAGDVSILPFTLPASVFFEPGSAKLTPLGATVVAQAAKAGAAARSTHYYVRGFAPGNDLAYGRALAAAAELQRLGVGRGYIVLEAVGTGKAAAGQASERAEITSRGEYVWTVRR